MALLISFMCADCNCLASAHVNALDNGTTLHCYVCEHDTVLRLLKSEELAAHDAAPDLLAACEEILLQFEQWAGPEEDILPAPHDTACRARNRNVRAYEACRVAIAKATQPKGGS